jgi:hypothetical protein
VTGFPGWSQDQFFDGWYQINTEGIATLYLAIVDEAIVTLKTDSPTSKFFRARIQNPEQFSIRRRPIVWPHGDTSVQLAAFGSLQLDNVDGLYSFLVGADLRDAKVIIQIPPALAFGGASTLRDAPIAATAILDNVTCNEDSISITLRDALATLDKPLPVRINPPFVDPGAANRMVPISLGAVRNVAPLLIDGPNRIYQIGDGPLTNVAAVRDGGAPLDPNATPPQYVPVLSASGMQLETDTVDKLTVDASSVGQQVTIPGAVDVLGGIGDFATWTGDVPDGWAWSNGAGSALFEVGIGEGYPHDHMANMLSSTNWYPFNGKYGSSLSTVDTYLQGGKAYRLTAKIFSTLSANAPIGGLNGGIQFRSAISNSAADAISPHGQPLSIPQNGDQSYVFEFRCPPGPDRKVYIVASAAGTPVLAIGAGGGIVYQVRVEELGEYLELPLTGINLEQFFYEWLVNRAGQNPDSYEVADLRAIDAATGYLLGYHVTEQPNTLDGLREVLDSFCATLFTDHLGVIRVQRLIDPKDAEPICDFNGGNITRPIAFAADDASELTTVIGCARNWDPLSDSDFVSDYDVVPAAVRTRYKENSQYQRTSSNSPAGQYAFAIGAPVFHSLIDDPADGQREIDRVVGIWSPRVYADGTVSTGKRRIVTFTALFDDITKIGASLFCDVRDLIYGTVVTLDYPSMGFNSSAVEVIGWELFPFGQKIIITGFCGAD